MARTYWAPKGQDWEFLGAYRDGHQVKDAKSPQAKGSILDIQGVTDVQGVLDLLAGRVLLVGLPAAIAKRLQARVAHSLPWAQIEGYVK